IVSIGRLIEKKGFADLVAACAILRTGGRDFTSKIIGEGPLDSALRAQISSLGIDDRVELVGPRSQAEVRDILSDATVFVLPCTAEKDGGMDNLPTVIMEAMSAGLPVISTPVAGVPEMVEEGLTGLLVPERDPTALAAAIEGVIANPADARWLGSNGLAVAREKFSIETSARNLREIFARPAAHPI
ncbi:MAG: glycosyltransferase, partial [Chthoniobacterales bacterium]